MDLITLVDEYNKDEITVSKQLICHQHFEYVSCFRKLFTRSDLLNVLLVESPLVYLITSLYHGKTTQLTEKIYYCVQKIECI